MLRHYSIKGFKEYANLAKRVLEANWVGRYTKPSPSLYPHQWNWDSGFIAIGYAHYNQKRAQQEILSLFQHQWPNGMVPQIVFNKKALGNYFPEPDFWQVPDGRLTSGITMPPVHATACLYIYKQAKDRILAKDFLKKMFPRLMESHRYLYRDRDPDDSGLVFIRHPWESGLDNSPAWDEPLRRISVNKSELPRYERKDLKHSVPADQRPTDDEYDRYIYLVDLFRRLAYNEEDIYRSCPFLIQDIMFNSILCKANRDLKEIGSILNKNTTEINEWITLSKQAISKDLWCDVCQKFESFDLTAEGHIHTATSSSFMPLFAGAASESQAETLYNTINSLSFCALHQGNCFTIPNYDMTKKDFDPKNYWRGPVWININWMIAQGLKNYGYQEKADEMKQDIIQLPVRFGFHEYFDSHTGKGYGSDSFSWTAALFIDLVYEYYSKDEHALSWLKTNRYKKLKKINILNKLAEPVNIPSENVASRLMDSIGALKDKFYDMNHGRIDYRAMKASPEYLDYQEIASGLQAFDPSALISSSRKMGFWINLYNTIVVHGIVELGIVSSVREVPDFFTKIAYQIGNLTFTADEIEHGILRGNARPPYRLLPVFKRNDPRCSLTLKRIDPRIHFALVCGSRSCAPIRFYDIDILDGQLDIAANNFINSSEVLILPEKNKLFLSQIFKWYANDFGGSKKMFQFLLKYLNKDEKYIFLKENINKINVEYLFYDWNLNH
ncbi:MAG: DUF547 domain-containing protein [Desulfobacterales bacterium]|nr:DUF547 domain-containing protein [Desulfobacterales bacterium]